MSEDPTGGASLYEAARAAGVGFAREAYPTDRVVELGGMNFHYLDWGGPDAPPVLMLHGMAQSAHTWDFSALALSDRYRVLALDQRGHGDSDWAPDGDYSLDAHLGDIASFVEAMDLRGLVMVGLSMGGRNAFSFAALHPELVRALVIVDIAPRSGRSGASAIRTFIERVDELDTFEEFVERVKGYNPRRSREQIRGSLAHNLKRLPSGRWTWKYDKALRSPSRPQPGPGFVERQWDYIERIECPTLVVRGAYSKVLTQEIAEETVRRLRHGELAVVDDAGHLVPGDNPPGFIRALGDFLDRVR
jgi:pimeloyl-ACP methyl ester carboxylesterase